MAEKIPQQSIEDLEASLKTGFGAKTIKTLATGVIASGTDRNIVVAAQSGIVDDCIEITELSIGQKVLLTADAGDTITLKHNNGGATVKILIQDDADFVLDEVHPVEFIKMSATTLVQVYDEVGAASNLADYADMAAMITGQSNQTIGNLYYTIDTDGYWVLIAKTASSSDYRGGGVIEREITMPCSTWEGVPDIDRVYLWKPRQTITVQSFYAFCDGPPSGGSLTIMVKKNNIDMLSTAINITTGNDEDDGNYVISVPGAIKGDKITVHVTAANGATFPQVTMVWTE